jgi:hypothetical protein
MMPVCGAWRPIRTCVLNPTTYIAASYVIAIGAMVALVVHAFLTARKAEALVAKWDDEA